MTMKINFVAVSNHNASLLSYLCVSECVCVYGMSVCVYVLIR